MHKAGEPPDEENPIGPWTWSASFRSGPKPREWHYGQRRMQGAPTGRQPATANA